MGSIKKKIRKSLFYYRSVAPFNIVLTFVIAFMLWQWRDMEVMLLLRILTLFKLIALALSFYFTALLRPKEFFYYYNQGISKRMIWAVSAGADMLLFAFVIVLTLLILT